MKGGNLLGRTFGKLKVIEDTGEQRIICECECGTVKSYIRYNILAKTTQSCGCLRKKKLIERNVSRTGCVIGNEYDLSGDFGVGYIHPTGEPFFFDKEDYEEIRGYTWTLGRGGYAVGFKDGHEVSMHRLLMPCAKEKVDHRNRKQLDNRKENLRPANNKENARNRSKLKNNTSGYPGVIFEKTRNKWRAQIWVDGKSINLGRYENIDDAINARKRAERLHFGDFAPQNSDGGI